MVSHLRPGIPPINGIDSSARKATSTVVAAAAKSPGQRRRGNADCGSAKHSAQKNSSANKPRAEDPSAEPARSVFPGPGERFDQSSKKKGPPLGQGLQRPKKPYLPALMRSEPWGREPCESSCVSTGGVNPVKPGSFKKHYRYRSIGTIHPVFRDRDKQMTTC
jgi:hypothetical protein